MLDAWLFHAARSAVVHHTLMNCPPTDWREWLRGAYIVIGEAKLACMYMLIADAIGPV
jgi:hypothetical protein